MKECKRCLFDDSFAHIHDDQECEYCKLHDQLEANANPDLWPEIVDKIKKAGKGKQYDCIVGISGGADSSILLWLTVMRWGLRPLVVHFDNRWNAPEAENNMKVLVDYLNVNMVTYKLDKAEFDNLNKAFLAAGVPDCDIPNDIAMTEISYRLAEQHGIKYIMAGHDFRTEGSTPKGWTYMDAKYINDVYYNFTGKNLKNYPLFTIWNQIRYGLKGIVHVRPFHYLNVDREELMKRLVAIGWQGYGAKHCENVYTEFIGAHVLPKKFGIDKRIVYLSAEVRSGLKTKAEAKELYEQEVTFDLEKIPFEYRTLLNSPIRDRKVFKRYNFKLFRPFFWLLSKIGAVPHTFYVKYCK
jgi:tRNA(Ile)-lysidine synthase TilS/MesJ